jgi:DNA repair photolyase
MERYKGRGALGNPQPRFLDRGTDSVDDGWYREELPDSIATQVRAEPARSIISRNQSPDIAFEQSINPYRGCEHGCIYCLAGDTSILMADGSTSPLADIRAGNWVFGTERVGWYRRYVKTQVVAHWSVIKPALRVTLEDGTTLTAGADHRFLSDRGWKFVTGSENGSERRPHLTTRNKLLGTGSFAKPCAHDLDYRRGYLCAMVRSRGLERADVLAQRRAQSFLAQSVVGQSVVGQSFIELARHVVSSSKNRAGAHTGYSASAPIYCGDPVGSHTCLQPYSDWPLVYATSWCAGFIAGILDAKGRYSEGILRIPSPDPQATHHIGESLKLLGFRFVTESVGHGERSPSRVIRVVGGLREHLRLLHTVDAALIYKLDLTGQALKSDAKLRIVSIEPLPGAMRLYDISTGTEDFIANGIVSHNCYARPSHAYVDLSPGIDFETKIFYKKDAARLLEEELAAPGYAVKQITLGANTDPYQPLEKELRVTRSLLEVFERTRHPVSIITKGTLVLRDLDLLQSLAADRLVQVFVSITTLDAELKRTMEPRAAAPQARLRVVRELVSAGVPTGVMVAPIIPMINDAEMEHIVAAIAAAGALQVAYVLLRLPHELKELFRQWLDEHFPDRADHVMSLIRGARGGRENDPRFGSRMVGSGAWAQLLRDRFALACRRHGLSMSRMRNLSVEHFRAPSRGGQMPLL